MTWAVTRKALWDLRWTAFWYALGLALYIALLMAFYPTIRDIGAEFEQLVQNYPEPILRAFGIEPGAGLLTSFAGFMHAEVFSFVWPLVAALFVVMSGAAVVAQEVERGTAELWLSVPATRTQLLGGKLLALLVDTLVVVLASLATMVVLAPVVDAELTARGVFLLGVVLLDFLVAVGGIAVLFSALSSERGKAAALTAGLLLAMYLAWVIAGISERWDWLRYLSIFTAYQPREALEGSALNWPALFLLDAIGLGCALAALLTFRRRDILA